MPTPESIENCRLHDYQRRGQREDLERLFDEQPEIERHADGGEEHTEQQPFEGLDVGLELMPV